MISENHRPQLSTALDKARHEYLQTKAPPGLASRIIANLGNEAGYRYQFFSPWVLTTVATAFLAVLLFLSIADTDTMNTTQDNQPIAQHENEVSEPVVQFVAVQESEEIGPTDMLGQIDLNTIDTEFETPDLTEIPAMTDMPSLADVTDRVTKNGHHPVPSSPARWTTRYISS